MATFEDRARAAGARAFKGEYSHNAKRARVNKETPKVLT